jgi:hypothetical protein
MYFIQAYACISMLAVRPAPDGIFRLDLIKPFPPDQVQGLIDRCLGSFSKGLYRETKHG